jgi:hypothetical protein
MVEPYSWFHGTQRTARFLYGLEKRIRVIPRGLRADKLASCKDRFH